MATRWAVATGNWSNAATWDGGTLPGAGDDVYADGKTVTVDVSATCLSVRTEQRSGGTAGGGFTLLNGVVLAADAIAGTTRCVLLSSGSAVLSGGAYGGSSGGDSHGAVNSGTGTLTIGFDAIGGASMAISYCAGAQNSGSGTIAVGLSAIGGRGINPYGVRNIASGTVTVGLNATGGSGNGSFGAANSGTGPLTVGLNATGGSGTNSYGAINSSTGPLTVGLNATGGSGATSYGAANSGTGTLTVIGKAVGNDYGGLTNQVNSAPGVLTGALATPCTIGGIEFGPYGQSPVQGRIHFSNPAPAGALGWTSAGLPVPIGDATGFQFPAESDVRANTVFANSVYVGSCAVPVASTVLTGVPTDDTVGTLTVPEVDAAALTDATADLVELLSWLTPVIPEVPSVVIPGPTQPTATVAWCYCFDEHGAPKEGVVINLFTRSTGSIGNTYTPVLFTAVSDAQGIARVEVPRDPLVRFMAYRGGSTRRVQFTGVDADTLQMPSMLGEP